MYQLVFRLGNEQKLIINNVKANLTILDIAFDNNIDIQSLCGGAGICKKCHIQIEEGDEFLQGENKNTESANEVYACQSTLKSGMTGRLVIKLD
ncbi:2Fe-2S iron-sulfur cluster binding domain-containing protein [Terrimonas pollutisoli]|uniref:2Fe-2S iron-sulfur cluster binding domain-containing protein n=1 Tax=Terrimonas pollutisoli TaxID=3034147 RepID=UPI0023EE2462|nr:2Fe-2S iron-sulfur cluster binding domain-containing protein [Terrimonas sp. H1YJ31]